MTVFDRHPDRDFVALPPIQLLVHPTDSLAEVREKLISFFASYDGREFRGRGGWDEQYNTWREGQFILSTTSGVPLGSGMISPANAAALRDHLQLHDYNIQPHATLTLCMLPPPPQAPPPPPPQPLPDNVVDPWSDDPIWAPPGLDVHLAPELRGEVCELRDEHFQPPSLERLERLALLRGNPQFDPPFWEFRPPGGYTTPSLSAMENRLEIVQVRHDAVARNGLEWQTVSQALNVDTMEVIGIERIQHRAWWHRYCVAAESIGHRNLSEEHEQDEGDDVFKDTPNANERWLWHGTAAKRPRTILEQLGGLKVPAPPLPDMPTSERRFFGTGLYFACTSVVVVHTSCSSRTVRLICSCSLRMNVPFFSDLSSLLCSNLCCPFLSHSQRTRSIKSVGATCTAAQGTTRGLGSSCCVGYCWERHNNWVTASVPIRDV